ncbi:hypothetical protein O3P69_005388 [Scylla paramamosain]|uniref:Uncharacterized protein n=1 Tax=Scylla paramamosain TaxID=85552 RepID=A0AAW0U8A2_SCYPA
MWAPLPVALNKITPGHTPRLKYRIKRNSEAAPPRAERCGAAACDPSVIYYSQGVCVRPRWDAASPPPQHRHSTTPRRHEVAPIKTVSERDVTTNEDGKDERRAGEQTGEYAGNRREDGLRDGEQAVSGSRAGGSRAGREGGL